jgi:O-antigen/teichoic acid export membrane protein
MAWTVESSADVFILGYFTTPQVVATYVIWWRIPQMLFDLCTRLAFSAFPSFSHSLGVSNRLSGTLLGKVGDVSSGLATLALLGISIWLPSFVKIWIGTGYAPQDSEILPFLMGMLVCLRTLGNLFAVFWLALARTGLAAALNWGQALIKVCLGVWLGREFGISGIVAASCVAAAVQVVVTCIHLYRSEILGLGPIVRFASLLFLASGLSIYGVNYAPEVGWAGLAFGAIATILGWGMVWLAIAWTGDLRVNFRSLLVSAQQLRST